MSEKTAPGVSAPVVLLLVLTVLFQQIWSVLPQSYKSDEEKYAKRPYKFQFNIEDHHHRKEEKNDKGIIMGEFGFVTADFFYLTTVYATDEEGKFRILARSRKYIGPPTEKPPTRAVATTRRPATAPPSPQGSKPLVEPNKPLIPAKKPQGPFSGLNGCSSCIVPTTTKKPPVGVNINDERPFPGTGIKPVRGQGIGGVIPPARPGNFGTNYPTRPGAGKPATSFKPGAGKPATSFKPGAVGPTTSTRPGQRLPVAPGSLKRPVSGINVSPGSRPGLGGLNQQVDRPVGSGGSGLVKGDKGGPNYRFNYTVGFHGHHETGYRGGSKEGGYFANHRDGEGQRVVYEANEFGYQPNVTKVRLSDAETPKEETEKEFGLKGYEFEWFN